MCAVSMIGDHYRDKWIGGGIAGGSQIGFSTPLNDLEPPITRAEFFALKADVEEMKKLLIRAKKYDEDNGEPNCEIDEKMDLLRRVAKMVGVSLDDVIKG